MRGTCWIKYDIFVFSAKLWIVWWCFFSMLCLRDVTNAVKVSSVLIPSRMNVSSPDPLRLDCTIEYEPEDKDLRESELVIQWKLNNILLFQWISNGPIFVNATLRDRIDTNFKIANNTRPTHMPLAFATRSVHLSGYYTCTVSTYSRDNGKGGMLQAFVPITNMTVEGNVDETKGYTTITCEATGLYPRPSIQLRMSNNSTYMPAAQTNLRETENGFYDVNATLVAPVDDFTVKTVFNCTVSLPQANYSRSIFYKFAKTGFQKFVSHDAYELNGDFGPASAEGSSTDASSRIQQNVILLFTIVSAICLLGQ